MIVDVLNLFFSPFLCLDDAVAPSIELGVVDLQLGVIQQVADAAADALVEAGDSLETGYSPLELCTVEDDGGCLVANEVAGKVIVLWTDGGKEVGGDMAKLQPVGSRARAGRGEG